VRRAAAFSPFLISIGRLLVRLLFRLRARGLEHLGAVKGGAVVIVNHVSFIDGILVRMALPGRPVFAIDRDVAAIWWVAPIIALADHALMDTAHPFGLRDLIRAARSGRQVVVFPESRISLTGGLMKCYGGAALVAERAGVPLVPAHLAGSDLTPFSYLGGLVKHRVFPRVTLTLAPARAAATDGRGLQLFDALNAVSLDARAEPSLTAAIAAAADRVGRAVPALIDNDRRPLVYGKLLSRLDRHRRTLGTLVSDSSPSAPEKTSAGGIEALAVLAAGGRLTLDTAEGGGADAACDVDEAAVLRAARGLAVAWDIHPGDRVFDATPPGDGLGLIAGLVVPLMQGATVFRFRPRADTRNLMEMIYDANATVLVVDADGLARLAASHAYDVHRVRLVVTSAGGTDCPLDRPCYRALLNPVTDLPMAAQSPFWSVPPGRFRRLPGVDPADGFRFDDNGFVVKQGE